MTTVQVLELEKNPATLLLCHSRPSDFPFLQKMDEIHGIAVLKQNSRHKNDILLVLSLKIQYWQNRCKKNCRVGRTVVCWSSALLGSRFPSTFFSSFLFFSLQFFHL